MTGNLVPCNPDMSHYDDLIEWAFKHEPDLVKKLGSGGVASIMLDGLYFATQAIRQYESKRDWDLTNANSDCD